MGKWNLVLFRKSKIRMAMGIFILIIIVVLISFSTYWISDDPSESRTSISAENAVTTGASEDEKYDNKINEVYIDDGAREKVIDHAGGFLVTQSRFVELLGINDAHGEKYANVILQMAKAVPSAKVYNMIVPNGCEYYVSKNYSILPKVQKIYGKYDDSVVGVNAFGMLNAHKYENIYFKTDHHWTQRGAYYAYASFMQAKGLEIDPIESFSKVDKWGYVGSTANFLSNTKYEYRAKHSGELLECFLPKYETSGCAYNDMFMQDKRMDIKVVNPGNGYVSFIGGDNPLTVMTSSVGTGKKLLIIKESYGNPFATWAVNNYSEVYVADPRFFNTSTTKPFKLKEFVDFTKVDDILILDYPIGLDDYYRGQLLKFVS